MRDVVGAPGGDLGDLLGEVVVGRDEPAAGFDVLEVFPRLFGQLGGQVLDEPGAAGRVEHAADVRLLEQQQLGVASDPAGETA